MVFNSSGRRDGRFALVEGGKIQVEGNPQIQILNKCFHFPLPAFHESPPAPFHRPSGLFAANVLSPHCPDSSSLPKPGITDFIEDWLGTGASRAMTWKDEDEITGN